MHAKDWDKRNVSGREIQKWLDYSERLKIFCETIPQKDRVYIYNLMLEESLGFALRSGMSKREIATAISRCWVQLRNKR